MKASGRIRLTASHVMATLVVGGGGAALVTSSAIAEGPQGRLFTVAGAHLAGGPYFGRPATATGFSFASSVLGMPDGGFLLGDFIDNRVVRVDPRGLLRPFAGNGRTGDSGDGGPATRARMWGASDLALRA